MTSRRGGAFYHFEQLLKRFEVNPPLTKQQLKRAYLKKVKLWHPDVNTSSQAKSKFVQLQDDYQDLEKYVANQQFLLEWEQYKAGARTISHLDFETNETSSTHHSQERKTTFYHSKGFESKGPNGKERYYYYHSSPFTRPEARNLDEDPFEQYRKYYEERLRETQTHEGWRKYSHHIPFVLSPQFIIFFTFIIPMFLISNFNYRRRSTKHNEVDDQRWIISREIKAQLWEELKLSNLENQPLRAPTSSLLQSIDVDQSSTNVQPDSMYQIPTQKPEENTEALQRKITHYKQLSKQYNISERDHRQRREFWDGSQDNIFKQIEASHPSAEIDKLLYSTEPKKSIKQRKHSPEEPPLQDPYYYTRQDKVNQLHRAVIKRDFDYCLYLLLGGAYAGYPDRKHRTALHYAAYSGQTDLCRLLLLFNANPLALDGFQETPIDAARQAAWKDVEKLLIFAASGSYKLASDLSNSSDPRIRYSQLFLSTVAACLGSYIPQDIAYHMGKIRNFSFR